jgi:uncharacterized membrane protein YfhO
MRALDVFEPATTAYVAEDDRSLVTVPSGTDPSASISLVSNNVDEMVYRSNSTTAGFGVFSEIYYNRGWKAFIDGKETPIIRTNYVLRGLSIPAGQHEIRFLFHPESYYTGETIALIAAILILVVLIIAIFRTWKERKAPQKK